MKSHILYLILALATLCGCTVAKSNPQGSDVNCTVVKFEAVEQDPVCTIECVWAETMVERGYSTSTIVPCSWYGRKVSRR